MAGQAAVPSAGASTVTIAPAATHPVNNCYPFGTGVSTEWPPFFGFVYKNIPAFQLKTGDSLAFDTATVNSADVQVDIELAATTANGGDAPALPFTKVVTNTQTPANPRGDTTAGNFELTFTAQAPFSFPGGGLIIRFSNPSPSYATDLCDEGDLVSTNSSDPSGNFVKRFWTDSDGVPPYDNSEPDNIGGFRLTLADVPPSQPVAKKKCKKHKKHRAASAKKHCKKKKH